MPSVQCSVVTCTNGTYQLTRWKAKTCGVHSTYYGTHPCNCEPPFKLLSFPRDKKDPDKRKKWIAQINRKRYDGGKWVPKQYDRICNRHFADGMPTAAHPYPTLHLGYTQQCVPKGRRPLVRHAHQPACKSTVPHDTETGSIIEDVVDIALTDELIITEDDNNSNTGPDHDYTKKLTCACQPNCSCVGCQKKEEQIDELNQVQIKLESDILRGQANCDNILKTDKDVVFYTGLPSKAVFDLLFEYVHPKVEHMTYWRGSSAVKKRMASGIQARAAKKKKVGRPRSCNQKDEMLLTLMKLRLGLLNKDLADRFQLAESTVSSIFTTWVKVLAVVLKPTITTPPVECIQVNMPKCFKKKYPRLRGILDCTEIYIERPHDLHLQAQTWSDYKKHNTAKVLVVITPRGRISYLSKAWGGRASDRHIVMNSGFMDTVEQYDQYLADRGFTIAADLLDKLAELAIPPGARGQSTQSASDVGKTKVIANLRIHVERAIERIKRFRLIKGVLPISLLPLIDDILIVCAGLCNLDSPLVQ